MVLSPPQDHAFVQFPSAQSKFDPVSNDTFRTYAANSGPSFANGLSTTNAYIPKPSRKRSRDDAEFEEAMIAPIEPSAPAPAPEPEEEPIYGEGMVLLNPRTGMGVSAESQTGTWYEEKVEDSIVAAPPVSSKSNAGLSDIHGRKSKRLDPSAPGLDDIALSSMHQRLQNTTEDDNHRILTGNNSTPNEPLVDDATCLLGISWQRVGGDDDNMAPAVRGWEKYINNQYSAYLQDCQITMKSRALNAYLVAARPVTFAGTANTAYYLFSEDLDQGRLVGSTWETCVKNLQSSPVLFEGPEVLRAADKRSDDMNNAAPLGTNAMEAGVPLLQSLSAQPGLGELNGGVGTGMEIDS